MTTGHGPNVALKSDSIMKLTETIFRILSVSNGKYDIDKTKPSKLATDTAHSDHLVVPDDGSLCVFFLLSLLQGCFSLLSIILYPILGDCVGGSNLQVGRAAPKMPLPLLNQNQSHM